jgi:hypothetical protein
VRAVSPADQARVDPSRDEDHELRLLVGDEVFAEMTRGRRAFRLSPPQWAAAAGVATLYETDSPLQPCWRYGPRWLGLRLVLAVARVTPPIIRRSAVGFLGLAMSHFISILKAKRPPPVFPMRAWSETTPGGTGTPSAFAPFPRQHRRNDPMSELVRSDRAGFAAGSLMAILLFSAICLITFAM